MSDATGHDQPNEVPETIGDYWPETREGSEFGATVWETVVPDGSPAPKVVLRSDRDETAPAGDATVGKGRYQILGEIARGGMGAVLRGRDAELNRDLAVKVVLAQYRRNPEVLRRFFEEAQIGGQLQHPGIVPIYDLGTFPDLRPFFVMKLVKGRTLTEMLKDRATPDDDRPRFLSIFEQVVQTIAYAHSKHVIHRDLKPLNVMVGAFGEVQVMDWGLAKILSPDGTPVEEARPIEEPAASIIQTARGDSDVALTLAGSRMGTPAYMAPEQARGEVERVDERADVFGLGAILCEILTGKPAYTGRTSAEIARRAEIGDLTDANSRLDASGADAELITLAKDCLAPEPVDRPRNASAVASRIGEYISGVQERLKAAEIAKAEANARSQADRATAAAERSRRKTAVALAASLMLAGAIGGGSWLAFRLNRQARRAEAEQVVGDALARAEALEHQAQKAGPTAIDAWKTALAASENARNALAGRPASPALAKRVQDVHREITEGESAAESSVHREETDRLLVHRLEEARLRLVDLKGDQFDIDAKLVSYADAFRKAGIVFGGQPATAITDRLAKSKVAGRIASILDDWSRYTQAKTIRDDLFAVANQIDPDNSSMRKAIKERNREMLARWADGASSQHLPPASTLLRYYAMNRAGLKREAIEFLAKARSRTPGDLWLNNDLAIAMRNTIPPRLEEAVRYLTVAASLKPDSPAVYNSLGIALGDDGKYPEAVAAYREAIRLKPDYALAHNNLGLSLNSQGKYAEAEAEYREAIRLKPDYALAHNNLGLSLNSQGKHAEAEAMWRKAISLDPKLHYPYHNLAGLLVDQGKFDDAVAELREAIRLKPDYIPAYQRLISTLKTQGKTDAADVAYRLATRIKPANAAAHISLGELLYTGGDKERAIAEFREAVRSLPGSHTGQNWLGFALSEKGEQDSAIAALREAVRLKPDFAEAHWNLGIALVRQGKQDEAIAQFHLAIGLKPDYAAAHASLGNTLENRGKYAEAEVCLREALRHMSGSAPVHNDLGAALDRQGKRAEAEAEFRTAATLNSKYILPRTNLGSILQDQGRYEEAAAVYRAVIQIKPDHVLAYDKLGHILEMQGKREDAVAVLREAIRLKPDFALARCNLGLALRRQGKLREALEQVRFGHELGSKQANWNYPSAGWLKECEEDVAIEERLPAFLKGDKQPKDNAERLSIAQICYDTERHAAATRFFREALEADPKLGDERKVQYRYRAVNAAILTVAGKAKDEPKPDEQARVKLRNQALVWLRQELKAWDAFAATGPENKKATARQVSHWKGDADIAAIHEEVELAKLPEAERKEWLALWADVDALLRKIEATPKDEGSSTSKPRI